MNKVGITERGDAGLDLEWQSWVAAGNPAILITKAPHKLANILRSMYSPTVNVIVHATITGFGKTVLEPNVDTFQNELAGYWNLCSLLGEERVILRIDPIIPTEKGIEKALKVLQFANPEENQRVRISFFDNYNHVKERFRNADLPEIEYDFHAPLEKRKEVCVLLCNATKATVEVCGEPGFDCIGCISAKDCEILGIEPYNKFKPSMHFQRNGCACLAMKQELLSRKHPCAHGCLYCYWKD